MNKLSYEEIIGIIKKIENSRSADLYDVLDKMGYPYQCLDIGIKPLKDSMKVIGPALTLMGTREPRLNSELGLEHFSDFSFLDELYQGCVLVLNAESAPQTMIGSWGEMMSYGARNKGASGIVVDGGTRDKQGILDIENWSCFARYNCPVESNQRWRLKEMNKPIFMTGTLSRLVRVNPGDWVFGDVDGVMIIPGEILEETVEKLTELTALEEITRQELASGVQLTEVFKKYNRA
jgi:4-hydroxy-4-methyl-2-oxoglutarate aldolase